MHPGLRLETLSGWLREHLCIIGDDQVRVRLQALHLRSMPDFTRLLIAFVFHIGLVKALVHDGVFVFLRRCERLMRTKAFMADTPWDILRARQQGLRAKRAYQIGLGAFHAHRDPGGTEDMNIAKPLSHEKRT